MLDKEGSGRESASTEALELDLRNRLAANGWGNRAEVIVLNPELEIWAFAASPHVHRCLGWSKLMSVREWLHQEGLWEEGRPKPSRPKEALERALFAERRPRSSSLYQCLGSSVHIAGCNDPAFQRLLAILTAWFPMGA